MSGNTRGTTRRSRYATGAALLAALAVAGCASGSILPSDGGTTGTSPVTTSPVAAVSSAPAAPATAAATTPAPASAPASAGTCYRWAGLPYLQGLSVTLRQMADDEEIYGAGSEQITSDGLAVQADTQPIVNILRSLPTADADELQDDVLNVAINAYSAAPDQLDAAAVNANDLAGQFAGLCYTSA